MYWSEIVPVEEPERFKTSSIPKAEANSVNVKFSLESPVVTFAPILYVNLSALIMVNIIYYWI